MSHRRLGRHGRLPQDSPVSDRREFLSLTFLREWGPERKEHLALRSANSRSMDLWDAVAENLETIWTSKPFYKMKTLRLKATEKCFPNQVHRVSLAPAYCCPAASTLRFRQTVTSSSIALRCLQNPANEEAFPPPIWQRGMEWRLADQFSLSPNPYCRLPA